MAFRAMTLSLVIAVCAVVCGLAGAPGEPGKGHGKNQAAAARPPQPPRPPRPTGPASAPIPNAWQPGYLTLPAVPILPPPNHAGPRAPALPAFLGGGDATLGGGLAGIAPSDAIQRWAYLS